MVNLYPLEISLLCFGSIEGGEPLFEGECSVLKTARFQYLSPISPQDVVSPSVKNSINHLIEKA